MMGECRFQMRPLKHGVVLRRGRAEEDASERPYVGLEHIESATGRLLGMIDSPNMALSDDAATQQAGVFEPGDVLFGKLRPYLAKAWVADFSGRCTTELLAMTPESFDAAFLRYVFVSPGFVIEVDSSTFGSKMPRAEWGFIGGCRVPCPPLARQRAIAAYLDRETAKIDAMIAAKERLLALLAEKRRALITHAVTRSLNPSAPMKDSGVEWLGEIPEHWSLWRLKYLVPKVEQGWSPQCYAYPAAIDEWGVVKAGCCNNGVFNPDENKTLPADQEVPHELEIQPNDVLMSRASGSTELIGSVAVVPAGNRGKLLLSDKTYRLHVDDRLIRRSYLALVLGSRVGRHQVEQVISGAAGLANNIAQSDLKEFVVPLPPVREQETSLQQVESELDGVVAMAALTQKTTNLLRERRSALIAAAVTGQIDVEDAA